MAPICTQGHGVPSPILLVRGKREQAKRKLMKCKLLNLSADVFSRRLVEMTTFSRSRIPSFSRFSFDHPYLI